MELNVQDSGNSPTRPLISLKIADHPLQRPMCRSRVLETERFTNLKAAEAAVTIGLSIMR